MMFVTALLSSLLACVASQSVAQSGSPTRAPIDFVSAAELEPGDWKAI